MKQTEVGLSDVLFLCEQMTSVNQCLALKVANSLRGPRHPATIHYMAQDSPYRSPKSPTGGGTRNDFSAEGLIATGMSVRGELTGQGDVRVEGQFEGLVNISGRLTIGAHAEVHAPVHASDIEIEGTIRGDVAAIESAQLRSGARVYGNVQAKRVGIDDGALLQGTLEMDMEGSR